MLMQGGGWDIGESLMFLIDMSNLWIYIYVISHACLSGRPAGQLAVTIYASVWSS